MATKAFEVSQQAARAGTGHRLAEDGSPTQALVDGHILFSRRIDGVLLHISDLTELQTTSTHIDIPANLGISVVLEGEVSFKLDGQPYCVSSNPKPQCFALNVTHTTRLQRQLKKSSRIRKLNISLEMPWLTERLKNGSPNEKDLIDFISQPCQICQWQASTNLQHLAESILQTASIHNNQSALTLSDKLQYDSKLLAFIGAAMESLTNYLISQQVNKHPSHQPTYPTNTEHSVIKNLSYKNQQKAIRIKQYLESRLANNQSLTITKIAKALGMSDSQLQRTFKQHFKQSIMSYIRQRRLEKSRDSLLQGNISLSEAAYQAGYNHMSNYIIAFKRLFGISPGALRDQS